MKLFTGGNSGKIHGDPVDLHGYRCFSAYYDPRQDGVICLTPYNLHALLDSGAFQDVCGDKRITPQKALCRQLSYETRLKKAWLNQLIKLQLLAYRCDINLPNQVLNLAFYQAINWKVSFIVSYDRLIDEKWINGAKIKQRWAEDEAWKAVEETIEAARYLSSMRETLHPRTLILGCQGVTARQYKICTEEVLKYAVSSDWIGLGGWCILGKKQIYFNEFKKTLLQVIPLIAAKGIKHVHLFGVLWLPAVGVFQAMCDKYGLTCSTDSKKPLSDCRWTTPGRRIQAGVRAHYWRDNVQWWQSTLENLQTTEYYRLPQAQLDLFLDVA